MSLDASLPAEDGDVRLGDTTGADDGAFDLVVDREAARDGISSLAERAKTGAPSPFAAPGDAGSPRPC
jgi:RNA polymerase sigma-B factor